MAKIIDLSLCILAFQGAHGSPEDSSCREKAQGNPVFPGRSEHLLDSPLGKDMGSLRSDAETEGHWKARRRFCDVGDHQPWGPDLPAS